MCLTNRNIGIRKSDILNRLPRRNCSAVSLQILLNSLENQMGQVSHVSILKEFQILFLFTFSIYIILLMDVFTLSGSMNPKRKQHPEITGFVAYPVQGLPALNNASMSDSFIPSKFFSLVKLAIYSRKVRVSSISEPPSQTPFTQDDLISTDH
uniref:Uncharacterized protein n=1 Tax=Glossina pallidipes TaxID=7398 RepID=A0A1A9ZJT1_GLOPL